MKVYRNVDGLPCLLGRADIEDGPPVVIEVSLFGPSTTLVEAFLVGTVTHRRRDEGHVTVERAILLADDQSPELLPGFQRVS